MKSHLVLAGKGLAGAGLTGIVLGLVSTARTSPIWPYRVFIGLLVVGIAFYLIGAMGHRNRSGPEASEAVDEAPEDVPAAALGPAFTDCWRYTPNGENAPGLLMITHKSFSHPGYMKQVSDKPPSVRIGVIVACEPLGSSLTTSALRDRFLTFLAGEPISELVLCP